MEEILNSIVLLIIVPVIVSIVTTIVSLSKDKKANTITKFKDNGIADQKMLLAFWYDILGFGFETTMSKYKEVLKEELELLTLDRKNKQITAVDVVSIFAEKTVIYASNRSIKILSQYTQWSYKSSEEKSKYKYKAIIDLYIPCKMIASLKKDFSGERISGETILKVKLNDYNKNKWKYRYCKLRDTIKHY